MQPMLSLDRASVLYDGTLTDVRLKHPECVAVASDGAVWCGGDEGEIYRVESDGSGIEVVASTGGFTLGIAFDQAGNLFTCDLGHQCVYRLASGSRQPEIWAAGDGDRSLKIPNFPVVDANRGCLYVSDSGDPDRAEPGIWRFGLDSGEGVLWYDKPLHFANGMALSPVRDSLYVVESFGRCVSRIPILEDGSAGEKEVIVSDIHRVPDGLAFDVEGNLYVSCYEPSRLYRVAPDGTLALYIDDPDAHTLCHPTNCAFRGTDLLTANLGRWHVTSIDAGVEGAPLL